MVECFVFLRPLGLRLPLSPDIRPGSLVTTTYAEVEEQIGDLARSEEDVLMYALFPNEAHAYLTAHREGAEKAVFLMGGEGPLGKEESPVDVNQIRALIKVIEESDVAEVIVEEGENKITLRKSGPFGYVMLNSFMYLRASGSVSL